MPIFELVQEMMFANTCVKFHDNRLRNEVCRAVTPFWVGQKPPIRGGYMGLVMPIFELVQEMMFVNTCVKFRDNRLRNEDCKAVMPFEHVRMGRSLYTLRGYNKRQNRN